MTCLEVYGPTDCAIMQDLEYNEQICKIVHPFAASLRKSSSVFLMASVSALRISFSTALKSPEI